MQGMFDRRTLIVILLAGLSVGADAQSLNHLDPRTPRTKDGKPNLTAPAPRLDGKPDLSGLWQAERTPDREYTGVLGNEFTAIQIDLQDINKNVLNVFWGLKPEDEPLRPEGAAVYKRHQENPLAYPHAQCLPDGVPADMFVMTFKMIQAPQEIVLLTELNSPGRQIYTDGRPFPKDPNPSWMGYSVGKWEGDTFVVDTIGLNDRGWLDGFGHPRSEQMHVTERYHRRDFGHMDLEFTFNDPKYYTRPFGLKAALKLIPDSDLFEYVCSENEKDRKHMGK
jgi:hypothetical protein